MRLHRFRPVAVLALTLVTGFYSSGQDLTPVVARLDRHGTLDPTFGSGGIRTLDFPGVVGLLPTAATLDAGGNLLLTGSGGIGGNEQVVVVKLALDLILAEDFEFGFDQLSIGG